MVTDDDFSQQQTKQNNLQPPDNWLFFLSVLLFPHISEGGGGSPYITENETDHCRDYASFRQQVEIEKERGRK